MVMEWGRIGMLVGREKGRIVFHYTPNHASWMNQVEIWLSILVRKVLKRGNFASV
jgi:predicted urease superfamily metal-dependent hydrolase